MVVAPLLVGGVNVLFAFLQGDLMLSHGWLSKSELLDAIAVGRFTPGPLSRRPRSCTTRLAGVPGASVATLAIFLPAFLMVVLLGPVVGQMRIPRSPPRRSTGSTWPPSE